MSKKYFSQEVVSLWNIDVLYYFHYAYCPLPRLWTLTRSWPPATRSTTRPSAAATLFCPRCAWYLASCCLSCHFWFLIVFSLVPILFSSCAYTLVILSLSFLTAFCLSLLLPFAYSFDLLNISCCLVALCLPSCCLDLFSDYFLATLFFCYAYPLGLLLIYHSFVFILPYSPTWLLFSCCPLVCRWSCWLVPHLILLMHSC
jgi:hypothetical protein